MNTDGLRTSSSPSGETFTSVCGSGVPIEPGLVRPIGFAVDDAAGLGLAPDLDHLEPERHVPAQQVGRDRRRAGDQQPRAVHADHLAHVVEHQHAREPERGGRCAGTGLPSSRSSATL